VKSYTVKQGELLKRDVARRFYGTPDNYLLIQNANPFLATRALSSEGTPKLQAGDVLTIPLGDGELGSIGSSEPDSLDVFLNGAKINVPSNFKFTETYDTCASRFSMVLPFDPERDKGLYVPYSNPSLNIFLGGEAACTGIIEVMRPLNQTGRRSMEIEGRSKTYILQKSNIPITSYPLERTDISLESILETWLLPLFSLQLEVIDGTSSPFLRVTAKETETAWDFVSGLAKEKGVLLSSTGQGKLAMKRFKAPVPVFFFEEGKNQFSMSSASYDSSKLLRTQTGYGQSPGAPNNQATENLLLLNENSYRVFELKNAISSDISEAVKWELTKALRDALKFKITVPGWVVPYRGVRWKAGEVVTVKAPSTLINSPTSFLIRSVDFVIEGDSKTAELEVVLPNAYNSDPVIPRFWE